MKARRRQRLLRRLVYGLAFAAFAAPAAQAQTSWYLGEGVLKNVGPSAQMNQRQVEQLALHEGRSSATALSSQQIGVAQFNAQHPTIPSESRYALEAGSSQSTIDVDRKSDLVRPSDLPTSFVTDEGGFNWTDAGLGAGTMLALLGIAAAGAAAARFRRGAQAA
jgi:hypothetical protein